MKELLLMLFPSLFSLPPITHSPTKGKRQILHANEVQGQFKSTLPSFSVQIPEFHEVHRRGHSCFSRFISTNNEAMFERKSQSPSLIFLRHTYHPRRRAASNNFTIDFPCPNQDQISETSCT